MHVFLSGYLGFSVLLLVLDMFSFVNVSQVIGWEGCELCTSREVGW